MNTTNIKRGKNKKGFTLVEVIVVLVIIAILIAIAVPAVMKYVDDANDTKDDLSVRHLNQATESYKIHLYADNELKEDIFDGITTDEKRQEKLKELGWIDDLQTSIYDDDNYFHWNVDKQVWERKPSTSSGEPDTPSNEPDLDKTILGDVKRGNDKGEWKTNVNYNVNDIISYTDKNGNSISYKCLKEHTSVSGGPESYSNVSFWKKIELDIQRDNVYETGDIIRHNSKFYKATKFDSTSNPLEYYLLTNGKDYSVEQILTKFFEEVVWNGKDNFIPA